MAAARKKGKRKSKSRPENIIAAEKRIKCMKLRKEGFTFEEIAKKVGFRERGAAYKAWQLGMSYAQREPANEALDLELQRLDELHKAFYPLAVKKKDPQAADKVVKFMERRAKLLGLDKPQKTIGFNITGFENWTDEELDRFAETGKRPGEE